MVRARVIYSAERASPAPAETSRDAPLPRRRCMAGARLHRSCRRASPCPFTHCQPPVCLHVPRLAVTCTCAWKAVRPPLLQAAAASTSIPASPSAHSPARAHRIRCCVAHSLDGIISMPTHLPPLLVGRRGCTRLLCSCAWLKRLDGPITRPAIQCSCHLTPRSRRCGVT